MTSLNLIDITKEISPGKLAVENLNLSIADGELLALLGPSGSGKTTTLRLIAGLIKPTRGEVLFDGVSVLEVPPEKRGAVLVFQEHALFPFMSVGKNVAFGLKLKGLSQDEIRRRVTQSLNSVRLSGFEDRWPDQLSGGQRQRVALARALVLHPKVLLLDEPLSNLEPALRKELREMISALQKQARITTIFVTHDQGEAVAVADRIALLLEGKIRQVGPPRDFYEKPVDEKVSRFFGGVNFISGLKQGGVVDTAIGPLAVSQTEWPDGRVLLTIRPEAIEIGFNGYNNLTAQIRSYSYRGQLAQCETNVNGVDLQVIAPPFHFYEVGDSIPLHLPQERIFLLPIKNK